MPCASNWQSDWRKLERQGQCGTCGHPNLSFSVNPRRCTSVSESVLLLTASATSGEQQHQIAVATYPALR